MELWIEEFLYRGRPPSGSGSELPPAWHVVLGRQADSPLPGGEKVRQLAGPMTPEQAAAEGFDIATIVEGINTSALAAAEAAQQEATTAQEVLAAAQVELDELRPRAEDLQQQVVALQGRIAELEKAAAEQG